MLKNEDIKQIRATYLLLNIIYKYTTDLDSTELYDKTGITSRDILKCMKALSHIEAEETVKHITSNKKSNEYNKANPEKHRQLVKESAKRHRDRVKQYQKEYYQKNKEKLAEYKKKHYEKKRQQKS